MPSSIRAANRAGELAISIRQDPRRFVRDFFDETLVGKQGEILEGLRDHDTVLVRSCHDSGKTFVAARAALWFLMAHPTDAIVISTAPSWPQVEQILWREIGAAYGKAKVNIGGRMLTTKLDLGPKWYAIGLATDQPTNLQGFHASNVLVVIDEADSVAAETWTALDSVRTSANARLLAIGNPLDPTSEFKRRYDGAGPNAKRIKIAAEDVLPLTDGGQHPYLLQRSWVEDKRRTWGEGSALWLGKVEAEWPSQGSDMLIPVSWLMRAKGRQAQLAVRTLGVDVARFGSNRTVRTLVDGALLLWTRAAAKEDTMTTAGRVFTDIDQYAPAATWVDDTGVGGGVTDRLRQLQKTIQAINFGGRADDAERFANKGSEMYWHAREAFEEDRVGFVMDDPEAIDELIADLSRPKYGTDPGGRIRVDKYGVGARRGEASMGDEERAARSPDRGDSYVLALEAGRRFIKNRMPRKKTELEELIDRELRKGLLGANPEGSGWTF